MPADYKPNPELPTISLIYTGGTIGSKVDYTTGGVYMITKPEELLSFVPEISGIANLRLKHLSSLASEDMTYTDWQAIAKSVVEHLNSGSRGIVITHGTDIMHYAAAALSFMLKDVNAPVIITGSQRSPDRGSSDAFMNLVCAAKAAASSDIAGVGICMHSSSSDDRCMVIPGTRARKMHTSRRDAFRPINARPIAYISRSGEIVYSGEHRKVTAQKGEAKAVTGFDGKVAIVKAYPNSDPEILDFYTEKGYEGIIMEGMGLGHLPVLDEPGRRSWLPHIKKTIAKGVVLGMTSQTIYGRVHPNVYKNLRLVSRAGVIYCEDMTTEAAYVKLGWLLGNYSVPEAKKMLNKNVAGEISERTLYDEFLI